MSRASGAGSPQRVARTLHWSASNGMCRVSFLAVMLAASGCAEPRASRGDFGFVLRARSPANEAVAGAVLSASGRELARTDRAGIARFSVQGRRRDHVALSVSCPEGFATASAKHQLLLDRYTGASLPELLTVCTPKSAKLAVIVRASRGHSLPILSSGRTVGLTDETGTGHALLELPVNTDAEVTLDTGAFPELVPRSPSFQLRVGNVDDVALLQPKFEVQPAAAARTVTSRRGAKASAMPPRPLRLTSNTRSRAIAR